MRPIKLFYSWQMDRPSRVCRDFIRRALDHAVASLAAQGVSVEIDSDTQGEPGPPPISETILSKIRYCDIFLADMTFVAEANGKLIPNPNVMAEYGYALRDKGHRQILLVMNTAYGPPEKLPFDLHHLRHPQRFEVPEAMPDGARRSAREALGSQLAGHIASVVEHLRHPDQAGEKMQTERLREAWWNAVQSRPLNDRPTLVTTPSVLVHLIPMATLEGEDLDPRVARGSRRLLRLDDDAEDGTDGRQWWSHGPKRSIDGRPNGEASWYGRLIQPGILEFEQTIAMRIDDDPTIVVNGKRIEGIVVDLADRALEIVGDLGLDGPFGIGVVLYGLESVELTGRRQAGRFRKASIDLPLSLVPPLSTQAGDHMRRAFDQLWMSAGLDAVSPSFEREGWAGYRA